MSNSVQVAVEGTAGRKRGGLWDYIRPPGSSSISSAPDPDTTLQRSPSISISLPATGPLDRSAVSARLMLGDAKAALQQLSDRVERVADEAANARREVAEAARGVEEAQGEILKQVQTAVKQAMTNVCEANIAHTSSLEAASVRIANLEASLGTQAAAIHGLSQLCVSNQLKIAELMDRITQTHSAVLALSPTIPLLQAIPTEIANANLETKIGVERLQSESLRTARDTRLELEKLCEAQTQATLAGMAGFFDIRDQAWRKLLEDVVGRIKGDIQNCRDDWLAVLSLHQQEVRTLLSSRPADSARGDAQYASAANTSADLGAIVDKVPPPIPQYSPVEEGDPGEDVAPRGSLSTPPAMEHIPGNGSTEMDNSHLCSSIAPFQTESESQSTTLSPPPEPDGLTHISEDSQEPESGARAEDPLDGRLFATLNQPNHAFAANSDVSTPDSRAFSVCKQKALIGGSVRRARCTEFQEPSAVSQPQNPQSAEPFARRPVSITSPVSGSIEYARAPTLGRSSPQNTRTFSNISASPPQAFSKRLNSSEGRGSTKRKKTRQLSTLQGHSSDDEE